MSDTQELIAATPPPPPGPRRRGLLVGLAVGGVAALVAVLITVYSGNPDTTSTATPSSAAPAEEEHDTNDPVRPPGHTTLDPNSRSDTEAAVKGNWPLTSNDEFDGTELERAIWHPYKGKTTDGIGQHKPENLSVSDGTFKITSHGYESGGMAWGPGQQYGRWEVRARAQPGTGYGAVILLWPDAEDFPVGGEVDFMEIPNPKRDEVHFVLHYGKGNNQDGTSVPGDFTQWHNYAVEWTPERLIGFIDGQEIYRTDDHNKLPPRPMHLAIQQDIGPYGNDWIPPIDSTTPDQVQLEVDWVRIYSL